MVDCIESASPSQIPQPPSVKHLCIYVSRGTTLCQSPFSHEARHQSTILKGFSAQKSVFYIRAGLKITGVTQSSRDNL